MNGDLATAWISACEQFIADGTLNGWEPYYVNIMFKPLHGTPSGVIFQMHRAIQQAFYARFCTRFARHPRYQSEQNRMPRLLLFPDRPVFKWKKHSIGEVTINADGLHFNGPMLIPPVSRFREDVITHIMQGQRYARRGIQRIHVKRIDSAFDKISDYAVKTVKWGRADIDDILILPRSPGEMPARSSPLNPEEKALKDIQSAYNVSDEVALQMLQEYGDEFRSPGFSSVRRHTYSMYT